MNRPPKRTFPEGERDMPGQTPVSTGCAGLDGILDKLRIGDNVVWSVDSVGDYRDFV